MTKKPIEEKHEFIKFIKDLYTNEIQLNFDDYFELYFDGNKNEEMPAVQLAFPNNDYYFLCGKLSLVDCPRLYNWISNGKACCVRINNKELDSLRKAKMSEFVSVETSDSDYIIHMTDFEFRFHKEYNAKLSIPKIEDEYVLEIPKDKITDSQLFVISIDNDNLIFGTKDNCQILFEAANKNFEILFKKEATYSLQASPKDDNGFRIVAITASGEKCSLTQYFKTI